METIDKDQIDILEKLAKNEELIGELYNLYKDKFSESADFWERLAREEAGHAMMVRRFIGELRDGKAYLGANRFKGPAIDTFSRFVNKEIASVKNDGLSIINALSISLDVEIALIESKYLDVFESDSVELKKTLMYLKRATEEHKERIRGKWQEERKRLGIS